MSCGSVVCVVKVCVCFMLTHKNINQTQVEGRHKVPHGVRNGKVKGRMGKREGKGEGAWCGVCGKGKVGIPPAQAWGKVVQRVVWWGQGVGSGGSVWVVWCVNEPKESNYKRVKVGVGRAGKGMCVWCGEKSTIQPHHIYKVTTRRM